MSFSPSFGGDFGDLAGLHHGEAGEHVAQVGVGIDATAAAVLDDGVEDGCPLAGVRCSDEQPTARFAFASAALETVRTGIGAGE